MIAQTEAVPEARQQLIALKEQLDQAAAFVSGLKTYTDGVTEAAKGATSLSGSTFLLSVGASTLQQTGTQTLKNSILEAEKSVAGKLLPLVEKDAGSALDVWKKTRDSLTNIGYDLRPAEMSAETVYVIRTDLK